MRRANKSGANYAILVVDDEADVRGSVAGGLTNRGFRVYESGSGRSALSQLESRVIDLVVLDLVLPDITGLEVLSKIRENGDVPVIILSGHGQEVDRVVGLEMGADDYLVKPFFQRELEARINSVLRRGSAGGSRKRVFEFDGLRVDTIAREVLLFGQPVNLTPREFDLLAYLAERPRVCCTRDELLREVWGSAAEWQDESTVTEHVRRVRHKLGLPPEDQRWLVTIRGVGYRFDP